MTLRSKGLVFGALIALAFSIAACDLLAPPPGIAKVVMAQGVQGANLEPVGLSDNYPPDQDAFHAIVTLRDAPKDTVIKAVWYAVDVGVAAPPDTQIDETEVKTEGSRNLDFTLQRSSRQWAPGLYQVKIYWNGKLDRTVNFTVVGTPQRLGTPIPLSGCPPATTQTHKVSNLVSKVIMAEGVKGEQKEPFNRTGEFLPNETVHAVVEIANAPANTKFRAVFFAVDAGGSTLCNAKLGEMEIVSSGSRNLDFTLQPSSGNWLLGKYRVDIYVNDVLDHTANYVVVTQKSVH